MQLNILRDFTEEMADQIRIYHYVEELVFSYRQFMTSHLKEEDIPLQECPLFIRLRFYDNKTQRELANEFHFTEGFYILQMCRLQIVISKNALYTIQLQTLYQTQKTVWKYKYSHLRIVILWLDISYAMSCPYCLFCY